MHPAALIPLRRRHPDPSSVREASRAFSGFKHRTAVARKGEETRFLTTATGKGKRRHPKKSSMFQTIDEISHENFTILELFAEFFSVRIGNFTFEIRQVSFQDRQEFTFFLFRQMKSVHNMPPSVADGYGVCQPAINDRAIFAHSVKSDNQEYPICGGRDISLKMIGWRAAHHAVVQSFVKELPLECVGEPEISRSAKSTAEIGNNS